MQIRRSALFRHGTTLARALLSASLLSLGACALGPESREQRGGEGESVCHYPRGGHPGKAPQVLVCTRSKSASI